MGPWDHEKSAILRTMELLAVILLFSLSIFKVASQLPDPLVLTSGGENFTCTPSTVWLSNSFNPSDCAGAVERFRTIEVETKRKTVYEFFQAGTRQENPKIYGQALPKQYTFGAHNHLFSSVARQTENKQAPVPSVLLT